MKKIISIILLTFIISKSYGQPSLFSLREITHDLMIVDNPNNNMSVLWWLPSQFWEILLDKDKEANKDVLEQLHEISHNYVIFGALKGKLKNKNVIFKTQKEIAENIIYTDEIGNRFFPEMPSKITPEMQKILEKLKSEFAKIMGQYAENIHLVVFKIDEESRPPNPKKQGRIYIKFFKQDYSMRLPIGTFLQPKICPIDQEIFKGNYKYCPYHGAELEDN